MATVQDVLDSLEAIAPRRFAFDFDRIGLQVGDPSAQVKTAVVSLDRSLAAISFAESCGAQLLLSHHPLIWDPLKSLVEHRHAERSAMRMVRARINFIAAHTNWDCAQGGINDVLAGLLGLQGIRAFGMTNPVERVKLVAFAPAGSVDTLIDAASEAGAGVIGNYSRCAFTHPGTGTFIGGDGAKPAVGQPGERESVEETRIEMVLRADQLSMVTRAVRAAHPYEEPAYDLYRLEPLPEQSAGRIGKLSSPISLAEFAASVDSQLQTRSLAWGDGAKKVSTVAVVGGAADGEWLAARNAGADVLVTGEVRQNIAVEASESGLAILAAGHFATEHPGCVELRDRMAEAMPDIEWHLFEPPTGIGGRPL